MSSIEACKLNNSLKYRFSGTKNSFEGNLVRYFSWGNQGKSEVLQKGYFKGGTNGTPFGEPMGAISTAPPLEIE